MRRSYARIGFVLFPFLLPFFRPLIKGSSRVYVAITFEGQVLLVKNWLARDTWRLAGGGIKTGESEKSAAIREIKEELGIDLHIDDLKHLYSGTLQSDSLGARYAIYHCPLKSPMSIHPSKFEIVDWRYFEVVPDTMHSDFSEVVGGLLKK